MKKIVAIMLLMSMVTSAMANWRESKIYADELLGITGGTRYSYSYGYNIKNDILVIDKTDKIEFALGAKFGEYNCKYRNGEYYIDILVGLYDENEKLKEKLTVTLDVPSDRKYVAVSRNQRDKINYDKITIIVNFLLEEYGHVRFIYPIYGEGDCEFSVNCKKGRVYVPKSDFEVKVLIF